MKYMVVKVFEHAALVWPMVSMHGKWWSLDCSITRLEWVVILSLDGLQVQRCEVFSPLALLRKGHCDTGGGFVFWPTTDAVPLLNFQAANGFAGVPEVTLKHVCDLLGLPSTTTGALTDNPLHMQLAIRLMLHVNPSWQEADLRAALLKKPLTAGKDHDDFLDDVDDDMLRDVVLAADQKVSSEFLKQRKIAKDQRQKQVANVKHCVSKIFAESSEVPKVKASKAKSKAKSKPVGPMQRTYAGLDGEAKNFLLANKPADATVFVDEPNGRYRISYPTFNAKSYSWTERGQWEAAKQCLITLWGWHEAIYADGMPMDLRTALEL